MPHFCFASLYGNKNFLSTVPVVAVVVFIVAVVVLVAVVVVVGTIYCCLFTILLLHVDIPQTEAIRT